MRQELYNFIMKEKLSPFQEITSTTQPSMNSLFKTREARTIHQQVLRNISQHFHFTPTKKLWEYFTFTTDAAEIQKRQEFFRQLQKKDTSKFKNLPKPRKTWKPAYDIIAVTEEEATFVSLQELGVNASLLTNENDCAELERYDIVQVIDCADFRLLLERLPQSVFIDTLDNIYLERHLESLSAWKEIITLLRKETFSEELTTLIADLFSLFDLMDKEKTKLLTEEEAERTVADINERIGEKIKQMTITGEGLMKMLGEGKMPQEILGIVQEEIADSGISEHVFNLTVPVTLDYKELESQIRLASANEYTDIAERIKRAAPQLKQIPLLLSRLSGLLLLEDFTAGIQEFITREEKKYPHLSQNLHVDNSNNLLLEKPEPISFQLDAFSTCSILTGANSGGKTTLLEHLLQLVSLFQLGLPISGEVHIPLFTEVYYFAKNKGSASKGAFETLLTQLSHIRPGKGTLILADEIEAVTEPGIAGKIITSTAEYFIKQGSFIVLATHLGQEIQKHLPEKARVDGIEAQGLDENFNLLVNHNPVMGRLAHSTPELIIERMAGTTKGEGKEYFLFLHSRMKEE